MKYIIIGKGGRHDIIADILGEADYGGFYDDNPSDSKWYLGTIASMKPERDACALIGFGALEYALVRERLLEKLDGLFPAKGNAIHSSVAISKSARFGWGNLICANTTLAVNVTMGNGCTVFSNTAIEHDARIGNNVNIAPGVAISGFVEVGDNAFIGAGAAIVEKVRIGRNAVIGAGSVVIRDVEDDAVYYGCPAKFIKKNDLFK
jgi:sugar O-acyltransferase (sialic acid O-acetyltransferase NeuD family)